MKLNDFTIETAHQGLVSGDFSALELTEAYLKRIKDVDERVGAYIDILGDSAREQAQAADKRIQQGSGDSLTGIPFGIKDLILIDNTITTAASKILENYTATYDATVIRRLKEAGAVFLGKTNLDEFAMGSSTENSAFKKTHNPWNLDCVPGGSSGGSAAAVAADLCVATLGTDTAGSIRQPAALCGVVGLKPTYGRVSRYGVIAMTSSLDQVGPITKNVKDAVYIFNAIAGLDSHDSTTSKKPVIDVEKVSTAIKGMKVGVPKEYFVEGMAQEVREHVEKAIQQIKELGAQIVEVTLPLTKYALAVYQLTATSEISTNVARYDGMRYGASQKETVLEEVYRQTKAKGFGDEVKRRIILGTYALSAGYYDQYYVKAQQVRTLIQREFNDIFQNVDCLVGPTSPSVAFKLDEKFSDPLTMYLSDIYTVPANIGGVCGISVPCGFVNDLPVGLQILARPFDEESCCRVAYAYEQATDWHTKRALQ